MKILKTAVIVVLLINAVGALFGSIVLIMDPSGSGLRLPIELLNHSPFNNYLIPAIVLFFAIGLFGSATLLLIFRKYPFYSRYVFFQGILLFGWISVQIFMLRILILHMHLPFLVMGVFLVLSGVILKSYEKRKPEIA